MTDTTPQPDPDAARKGRFLELRDVAEELNTSENQIYALVRRGDLEGVKIGGRGQWRVERDKLEDYITRLYAATREYIAMHPYAELDAEAEEGAELLAASNSHPPQAALNTRSRSATQPTSTAGADADRGAEL